MLAITAPRAASDTAPPWLVSEGTTYSKAEFQRVERGRIAAGGGGPKGKQDKGTCHDPKGKGKGGQGGGGASGGAVAQG